MFSLYFSRPLTSPQSSGHCLLFFEVPLGVGDIFGRAFRFASTFSFSGAGILGTWWTDLYVYIKGVLSADSSLFWGRESRTLLGDRICGTVFLGRALFAGY